MSELNPMIPGVYTIENSALPPSAGQVPTAIPAFIGYTEKAERDGKSLEKVPTLISSMDEYVTLFGGAPLYQFPINLVESPVSGTIKPESYDFVVGGSKHYKIGPAEKQRYYNFNCIRMFYLNGGGQAYIVSVGKYDRGSEDNAQKQDLLEGLELLRSIQFPKPTMILIPDALALGKIPNQVIQQQMLAQAGELKDRVALLDVYQGNKGLDTSVIGDFRESVGVSFLSYGISYYPWLDCAIIDASEITAANLLHTEGTPTAMEPQNLEQVIQGFTQVSNLNTLSTDLKNIESNIGHPNIAVNGTDKVPFNSWKLAYDSAVGTGAKETVGSKMKVLVGMWETISALAAQKKTETLLLNFEVKFVPLQKAIANLVNSQGVLAATVESLAGIEKAFGSGTVMNGLLTKINPNGSPEVPAPFKDANKPDKQASLYPIAASSMDAAFSQFLKAISAVQNMAKSLLRQNNISLYNSSKDYQNLMKAVTKQANVLPPSGAMAGVYSKVDNTRGVWTAPANLNIDGVESPCVMINDDQQESLSVDVLAGKSINAIRTFYGRGPAMIWGARTLDGNSLDYRYINVRRTLIMIEESVKNAAFSVVFEANDANTWVSVKGMISNFLHGLWASGALIGKSPADAYTVEVGLGSTMTAQDLLEGIMRVSVKLAIVRPAEFIVITYEQEMAKSG